MKVDITFANGEVYKDVDMPGLTLTSKTVQIPLAVWQVPLSTHVEFAEFKNEKYEFSKKISTKEFYRLCNLMDEYRKENHD